MKLIETKTQNQQTKENNMEIQLTQNLRKRTLDALKETQAHLNKELNYSEHLQDKKLIAFYKNHINKLNQIINDNKLVIV